MDIVTDPSPCVPPVGGSAVTIGAYDGVHLGHRALLGDLSARAEAAGLSTVVVTFDRHPAYVVRPTSAPRQLTTLEQKLELLADCGIDRTLVVPFDATRAEESAEDFVKEVLVDELSARLVVVGEDFHFGPGRKGNVALRREIGATAGFEVDGVSLRSDGGTGSVGQAISSTRVCTLVGFGVSGIDRGEAQQLTLLFGEGSDPTESSQEPVHSSNCPAGQVLTMRSTGTPASNARWAP